MSAAGLRIAMVCPYSLARPGGVQGQVVGLSRSLRARGHHVTVVAPDVEPDASATDGRSPGHRGGSEPGDVVTAGKSWSLPANGSRAPVALSPLAAARVARLLGRGRFDVAHLHEPLAPVVGYGCLLHPGVPMVGTFHRSGGTPLAPLLRPVTRRVLNRLSARVAVSEQAAATARSLAPGRYEVLFNGVEVDRFASAPPWPTTGPTVLFLGRHERRKGLGVLLDAFEQVAGATLWVAGDGPDTAELRRRHPPSSRVQWLGLLAGDEVASRLSGADVLCAPSLYGESFGMVLLEAMAARCAVVASDIPGYREAAGGHAVLVRPGDPAAWTGALAQAVEDAVRGEGACSTSTLVAASAHAEQWSMDRLTDRYEAIYEAICEAVSHPSGGLAPG